MKKQIKIITVGLLQVLLASFLLTHCSACNQKDESDSIQKKMIEAFKNKYVQPASFNKFDTKITSIKTESVTDINARIEEFESYKTIATTEKKVESTTDQQQKQGYLATVQSFINTSKSKVLKAYNNLVGKQNAQENIIQLTKLRLSTEYQFEAKLNTLDEVIGCADDMVAILKSIEKNKK